MRALVACVVLFSLACMTTGAASAGHVDHTLLFSQQDLAVTERGPYHVFALRDCDVTREVGKPQMPVATVTLALPCGATDLRLEVMGAESREFIGPYHPFPAQRPSILPIPGVELPAWRFTEPTPSTYRGASPYPPLVAEISSEGTLGGNKAVGVAVYPLQYLPSSGKVRLFSKLELRVHYQGGTQTGERDERRGPLKNVADRIFANRSAVSEPRETVVRSRSRLDPGDYEYVIVTDAGYVASFQPLADWKTRKGVPTTTVTVDWIESNYEGEDLQSRIRAFITDAYQSWGSVWFLLGGDTQVIPARSAYAMTSGAGASPVEDQIGCDLYYSDLDGTWDLDGDRTYGEIDDDVDLYPDVFVGRVSARTNAHVQAFVAKLLAYEMAPPPDIGLDMLMAAEVLWSDPFTDSGIGLNMIDREYVPPRYDPIEKLYETLGNESATSVRDALNDGQGHFLHSGHAWFTVLGCGDGYLDRPTVDGLTNGLEAPVAYSIGCWPAAFDLEGDSCIAEHFLRNPTGGSVAFIGNSRYGWGSPGNPGYGYSDRFMQRYYSAIFETGPRHVGSALATAKAQLIPFSQSENVYRWHQYELNLLGDPEMPVWTNVPEPLEVSHPDSAVAGAYGFDVSVWTASGPVENALVCLRGGDGLYERASTGRDGSLTLDIEVSTPESLDLTVTAPDCQPYIGRIGVSMSGAFVRPAGVVFDDTSGGNGDGLVGPGETVDATVTLRNHGSDIAPAVQAALSSTDPLVQVVAGTSEYGDIAGGTNAAPVHPFTLSISPSCPNGHVALLELAVSEDGVRSVWPGNLTVTVSAPVASVVSYAVDDVHGGDGDGSPEPGESLSLMLELRNDGLAAAEVPTLTLSSLDPDVQILDGDVSLQSLGSDETAQCLFEVEIAAGCHVPHFPELRLQLTAENGYACADTFAVSIGQTGLFDDFESGAPGWTHSGQGDLWALTGHRSHSGATSWYAGAAGAWEYENDMDAALTSPEFVAGMDTELRFWCWYEFPTYHEDGLYVELMKGGATVDTLDFIGSGGALGSLDSIGNDWLEYRYTIEGSAGETLSVRFRMSTDDSDVAEGVYIDDVSVTSGGVPTDTGADELPEAVVPAALHQNRPNPFTSSTMISFSMNMEAPVVLSVYNIQGRLIRTIVNDVRGTGDHSVPWDGRDELGADVAAGVYLYRLTIDEYEDTGKMILVR